MGRKAFSVAKEFFFSDSCEDYACEECGEITQKMFYKVNFSEDESPVVLLCCNCAFKLPTYQEIDWSRTGDVQTSDIEELPFYELVNRRFTCPANSCVKILNFQEFKEKNCCEGATNPLLAWI